MIDSIRSDRECVTKFEMINKNVTFLSDVCI